MSPQITPKYLFLSKSCTCPIVYTVNHDNPVTYLEAEAQSKRCWCWKKFKQSPASKTLSYKIQIYFYKGSFKRPVKAAGSCWFFFAVIVCLFVGGGMRFCLFVWWVWVFLFVFLFCFVFKMVERMNRRRGKSLGDCFSLPL